MFGGNYIFHPVWIYEREKYLKQYQTAVRVFRVFRFSKWGILFLDFYKSSARFHISDSSILIFQVGFLSLLVLLSEEELERCALFPCFFIFISSRNFKSLYCASLPNESHGDGRFHFNFYFWRIKIRSLLFWRLFGCSRIP